MSAVSVSPRDALFELLRGGVPETMPKWLLFPYHRIGCYVDVRTHPVYRKIHEASQGKAVILNRRKFDVPFFTEEVKYERGKNISRMIYGSRELYEEKVVLPGKGTKVKKYLDSEEDLELFCSFPVLTDRDEIYSVMDRQLEGYLEEKKEFPQSYGSMMLDLGEPIGRLYQSSNLEEYSIWSLTAGDMVVEFLEKAMERYRHIYNYCLERDLAEVYFLVGSELASPPLVSRETFRKWIVPYAGELIEMIHSAGCFAIQHYHGQIKDILPDFLEMAPDALHTIEAPPVGNCTLEEAFDIVGDSIALIGNIQYDDFRSMKPSRMRECVRGLRDKFSGKRFMLSPTAGPFDACPSERLLENYIAFLDA